MCENIKGVPTKLLLDLRAVKIKVFQRVHHSAIPFTVAAHIVSATKIVSNLSIGQNFTLSVMNVQFGQIKSLMTYVKSST